VEGALIHQVKAGLVAADEGDGGAAGEAGEGVREAVEVDFGGLGDDLSIEEAGFDGPGAAQAPMGRGNLLDDAEFQAIGGLEVVDVAGQEGREGLGALDFQGHASGQEAVADGVSRGAPFRVRGNGAAGESSVGARSESASKG